ncbi:forkhead box protein R1 isoform X2 [Tachyglossus aculeatus]|uniref:forkhead box protein R1 isoform X2 n=1 Tax=Tachyglossus aculeatus TaxID=9261 RepID=UPI0018F58786|nr:forkhead box protein R1 isoform X2 [Tachyglossus aculeatus]
MDVQKPDFWLQFHGQAPGLLNWAMDEELKLLVTSDHLPPDADPRLWLWVNPNIVCPITGSQRPRRPPGRTLRPPSGPPPSGSLDCEEEEEEEEEEEPLTSPSEWEMSSADEENGEEEDTPSSPSPPPHRSQARLLQPVRVGGVWPRPPLNYCHLITLALRNSPPCGLNVRQIYDFTRRPPKGGRIPSATTCASAAALRRPQEGPGGPAAALAPAPASGD